MARPESIGWHQSDRELRLTAIFADSGIASSEALFSLLATIYRNRPKELAHAQRVAGIATRIAEELGLQDREIVDIERAAWLHDFGKLIIPDREAEEDDMVGRADFDVWTRQLFAATEIIDAAPALRPAAALVMASRECVDGSGFPRHLEGSAIPIGARILHVADTFDALTELCHTFAVSPDSVNAEIARHAGTRFDSAVVAAWLRLLDGESMQHIPKPGEPMGSLV
jgi:response regulator RpfG family c-di-GMP phosphodiesterase